MSDDPIRVLVIEDDLELQETLVDLLSDRGYQVQSVPNSEQAVELAVHCEFDVVVTDIRSEGKYDGLSALEKVRETQPEVSGMVITGYSTEDYALRAVKLKVDDYLKKPFQLTDFVQRIESIASQKRKSKELAHKRGRLRRTLLWFAEQVAASGSELAEQESRGVLDCVARLSDKLGLGQELALELTLAAALTFAEERIGLELPSYVRQTIPYSVSSILRHRFERWDGQGEPDGLKGEEIPIGSRILHLAMELGDSSAAAISSTREGEFDPGLVALLDSKTQRKIISGDARSLLAVGLALEEVGQVEQALATFRTLASDYPGTRSEVFGSLGQARMCRAKGDLEAATSAAERSFSLAKLQGPILAGQCGLQAGILLSQLNHDAGKRILVEASRLLNEVRDVAGKALSVLALFAFHGVEGPIDVAARTLLASEFTPDLLGAAGWLSRFLLKDTAMEESLRRVILGKLVQEASGTFVELCRDSSLSEEARIVCIRLLREHHSKIDLGILRASVVNDPSAAIKSALAEQREEEAPGSADIATLRLRCLGAYQIYRGDERLDSNWKRQKSRHFFAYLLSLGSDRTHADDALVEVFWPGDPDKGRASLRAALSYLRRELSLGDNELNYFLKPPGSVRLNPSLPLWFDLHELEAALARMRQLKASGQVEKAVAMARQAARLYEGPFLEDCYMDWAVEIRGRTDFAVADAFVLLLKWCEGTSRHDEAIEYGQRLLQIDPSLEEGHAGLIRAYLAQNKTVEARRQYERCTKALREELDVEPSEELQELASAWL